MFNFHAVLMSTNTLTGHKQLAGHKRIIVPIELPTPRLTRLTETITNSLSGTHTATKTQPVFTLALIQRNKAHLPAPDANYLLIVHPKTLAVPNKRFGFSKGERRA
jgi:hypothetical protein